MSTNAKPQKLRIENLQQIEPITDSQNAVFSEWKKDQHLILNGSAGTGKTFMGMYLALREVLDRETPYDQVVVIRSIVPTRDIGFLPGDEEEKKEAYTVPYKCISSELFEDPEAWAKLTNFNMVQFMSTSFIRGVTLDNCIIVVDEMQNMNYHELCSIITRVGNNTRIVFSGDYYQSDFRKRQDQEGILKFLSIMENMSKVSIVEFTWKDIVRSDLVREFIITKEMIERS
jgi:phosphate starvation-inducible PhoH-like protein